MYETIYYNDVQYGDVLRLKKKKEDCIFQEKIGIHVFYITQNNKTTFKCSKAENWHL